MKILTKVLSVVAILCLAFCLCILPVAAAPAYTEGEFANDDYLLQPLFFDCVVDDGVYRIPVSQGYGLNNSGIVQVYGESFRISTGSVSVQISGGFTGSLSVSFAPLMLPLSDLDAILGDASLTKLIQAELSGVLYSTDDGRSQEFSLSFIDNSTSYYSFGNAIFDFVSLITTTQQVFTSYSLSDLQTYISSGLGYEYIYIDSFVLGGSWVVLDNVSSSNCGFNSPYRDTYYSNFDFPERVEYIDEQPDLVAWIYDVLQGLFSLQIFGDVSLGTLLLVAISVPLLVSMLKAIAGG